MAPDQGRKKKMKKHPNIQMKNGVKKPLALGKQIRDLERLLKRDMSQEMREAQERRLKDLKLQRTLQRERQGVKADRKLVDRYKQVKFFERRKVERRIRRAEKELRNASDEDAKEEAEEKLAQLKEDLEYVRFFPKTEKYVSLFKNNNDEQAVARREKLRQMIKANIAAAAAAGVDLEETGSEEEYPADISDDDFFLREGSDVEKTDASTDNKSIKNNVATTSNAVKRKAPVQAKPTNVNSGVKRFKNQESKKQNVGDQTNEQAHPPPEKEKRKRKRKRPKKK